MKKLSFAIAAAASLGLAACGGQGDDALGENAQENLEAQAENLDALAANAANEAQADAFGNAADQLREQGEDAEENIDDSDVNAAAADEPVQGM